MNKKWVELTLQGGETRFGESPFEVQGTQLQFGRLAFAVTTDEVRAQPKADADEEQVDEPVARDAQEPTSFEIPREVPGGHIDCRPRSSARKDSAHVAKCSRTEPRSWGTLDR